MDVVEGGAEVGNVFHGNRVEQGECLGVDLANCLLDGSHGCVELAASFNGRLLNHDVLFASTNTDEGSLGLGGHVAEFRVCSGGDDTVQTREELGQELLSVSGVLNQLAHVVDDDSCLAEDGLSRL